MTSKIEQRPDCWNNDIRDFLFTLQESGVTNMFGSPQYVQGHFGVTYDDAKRCFSYWAANWEALKHERNQDG